MERRIKMKCRVLKNGNAYITQNYSSKHKAVDLADRLLRSKNGVFPKVSIFVVFFTIVAKCSFKFWRST